MVDLNIQQMAAQPREIASAPSDFASEVGKLAGFEVRDAHNPLSVLEDSAEELTFEADNTEELALKERKTKEGGEQSSLIATVKLYQEVMEQSWRQKDAELLFTFLRNNRSAEAALSKVREWAGGDPSETWAFLKQAAEKLQNDAPQAALTAISEAIAQLEKEAGPRIQTGILGAVEGMQHPELGSATLQGDNYRQVACTFYDQPEAMFNFILEKYGMENFEAGLDFLFRTLANDLATDAPSHGKTHLEAVGQSLGNARILNSAHTLSARFLDRWETVHGVKDCALTPMQFLQELLHLKQDRYLSANSFQTLMQSSRAPDIEHEVLFAQELLGTARNFSPLFFDGVENRAKFIDAVQEAVDNAITREDEWLASQG
jgi:type III secretion protein W